MKLFKKHTKIEGETFATDVFLSFGKCFVNNEYDGWYVKLESPFKRMKDYVDPATFLPAHGPCRYKALIKYRTKYPRLIKAGAWSAV
jgi:hypothetical protein